MDKDDWLKTYLEDRFGLLDRRFEKIEEKLDVIARSHWTLLGKVIGIAGGVALLAELTLRLML